MATLAAIRTRVRNQLGETSAAIWSDTDLDEAINATVEDYNLIWTYPDADDIAAGDGDLALSVPSGAIVVTRVTYADGTVIERRAGHVEGSRANRERQSWEHYGAEIVFTRPISPAQDVTVRYERAHAVTEVPEPDVGIIVAGGVYRALEMRSVDDLRRQGASVEQGHRDTVAAALARYDALIDRRRRRVKVR